MRLRFSGLKVDKCSWETRKNSGLFYQAVGQAGFLLDV